MGDESDAITRTMLIMAAAERIRTGKTDVDVETLLIIIDILQRRGPFPHAEYVRLLEMATRNDGAGVSGFALRRTNVE